MKNKNFFNNMEIITDDFNCMNCQHYKNLEKWTYMHNGVNHEEEDGFVCAAFLDEGTVIHMVGNINPEFDKCEMFIRKE